MKLLKRAQTAIEQRVLTVGHDESVLNQSNRWMRGITWGLICTTGLGVAWLAFAKTEEIVVAPGKLVPIGAVQEVQMPIGGRIEQILVKDGDSVKSNQVLIRLDTESTAQKGRSLEEGLRLKNKQLELKEIELSRFQSLNQDSINTLKEKIVFENEILSRFKQLSDVGASAELQYLQQRNTVQQIQGELREKRLDGLRLEAILGQDIQRLKADVANLKAELTDTQVTLRYQELRAPVAGVVFDLQPPGIGFSGRASEILMKIVPFNKLEAKVEIPSSDIGFVQAGMKVDLSIDSYPATDFGVLHGTVNQVGSDALPPDPAKQELEYRYPATVGLREQTFGVKNGDSLPLQPGMSLKANIKLRKVSYLQLLLGTFKDKTDSLRKI